MTKLYWFGWPSHVGGADTKLAHLLKLLAGECNITVVPNKAEQLAQAYWRQFLEALSVKACLWPELPERLEGWAVALCNGKFFEDGIAAAAKMRGLRVAWSSEMMWHFEYERAALLYGIIDTLLYVSPAQRAALEPASRRMVDADPDMGDLEAESGCIVCGDGRPVPWVMTGNYIDPADFPFHPRGGHAGRPFTIGRVARPDPSKFPGDFPDSYEGLGLRAPVRFRVMAWSEQLAKLWEAHRFDERWELLPAAAVPAAEFHASLDLFVYELGPLVRESWGRAVVEAMLTGAVPLAPDGGGHHLERLIEHGVSGFLCETRADYGRFARLLQDDPALLSRMSMAAREHALTLCDAAEHRRLWRLAFG